MPSNARVDEWASRLNFAGLEQQHGLPAGILTNLVYQESRGNENAIGPQTRYGRAKGLCQILDSTAGDLNCDPMNPSSAIQGAARYLENLMDMFGGDPEKAIAAYNYGPGNMRSLIRRHGENWREHLPTETSNYLRIVGDGIGQGYVQRAANGQATPEEADAEEQRRRSRLREFGMGDLADSMGQGDLLSQMFFALISMAVEKALEKMGPAQTASADAAPATVPTGTTVTPPATPTPAAPAAASPARVAS